MEATSLSECVLQYRVGEVQQGNAYEYLAKRGGQTQENIYIIPVGSLVPLNEHRADVFLSECLIGEESYMEDYCNDHYALPDGKIVSRAEVEASGISLTNAVYCKDKKGRWNKRKFLPNAYTSAKSVISNSIKFGIPVLGLDGTPYGKSYLQKRVNSCRKGVADKKAASTTSDTDALSKYKVTFGKYTAHVKKKLSPEDWATFYEYASTILQEVNDGN